MTKVARQTGLGVTLVLVLTATAHAAAFKVDPARSAFIVRTFKEGVGAVFAHDHVVEATEFSGIVDYDPAAPDTASVTVDVRAASLRVDDPALRRKLGLAGEPSGSDLADIDRAMKGPNQLDVARYPAITFASTRITREAGGRYVVTGDLTIHGVTREVSFPAQLSLDGDVVRGTASLTLKQSHFGYRPYRALLGAIKNKDEVTLSVDLVATR